VYRRAARIAAAASNTRSAPLHRFTSGVCGGSAEVSEQIGIAVDLGVVPPAASHRRDFPPGVQDDSGWEVEQVVVFAGVESEVWLV
jgi:hypothetical protein